MNWKLDKQFVVRNGTCKFKFDCTKFGNECNRCKHYTLYPKAPDRFEPKGQDMKDFDNVLYDPDIVDYYDPEYVESPIKRIIWWVEKKVFDLLKRRRK